jgi:hypothetical protein
MTRMHAARTTQCARVGGGGERNGEALFYLLADLESMLLLKPKYKHEACMHASPQAKNERFTKAGTTSGRAR